VVQQRAGVQLKGGVGETGDAYERHADDVAALVVQGKSAESLLDRYAGGGGASSSGVQRMDASTSSAPGRRLARSMSDPGPRHVTPGWSVDPQRPSSPDSFYSAASSPGRAES